jgi:hypothetical protein
VGGDMNPYFGIVVDGLGGELPQFVAKFPGKKILLTAEKCSFTDGQSKQ